MASPTITPPPPAPPAQPPQPPMAPRRSVAGPIVLILVGVVCMLATMGMIDKYILFSTFARYWPLLLILWGLIKLFESWDAQRRGYRPRGIGAGGVVLVIFLIIFGSGATAAWKWGPEINIDDNSDIPFFIGTKYTFTDTNTATLPPNGSVRVVSDRGDVKVTTSSDDKVHLVTNYVVYTGDQSTAQKMHDARVPHFDTVGSVLVLTTAGSGGVDNAERVRANMELQVPRKAAVDILTMRGDIRVVGRDGEVKAQTSRGDGQVEDVNGRVDFHLRHGDFSANRVVGDLALEGSVSDVTISDIGGQVELKGDYYGDISVGRVAKAVRFNSSRTQFEVAKLDGDMRMESGDLRVTALTGPVTLRSRSKDVHFDDLTGDVSIDDTNAQMDIRVSKAPVGNVDITNRNGEIRLTLPANAAFTADAETRNGEIRSDFTEIKVDTTRDTNHASGKVGNGGGLVRLRTQHADIEIRRAP